MGFSPLANMSRRIADQGRSWSRGNTKITGVGLHHNAGVNAYGEASNPRREVSANYWIANDGTIIPNIDETRRAFTSGAANYPAGAAADMRNITIEVSNSLEGVRSGSWAISDAAMKSLIALIADIYKRHNLGPVRRSASKGLGVHSDWVPTACPGPYIMGNMRMIVAEAEKIRSGSKPAPTPSPAPAPKPYSGDASKFLGATITTSSGWYNYTTAANAKNLNSAQNLMPAGKYKVTSVADGQPHLVNENGKHSGWVHSSVLEGQKAPSKPKPKPKPSLPRITLKTGWYNYKTAANAKALKNAQKLMPAGTYEITKTSQGQPHLRNVNGKHSGWVHQSVLGGPQPAPRPQKSVSQMATEVIQGKHGTGHANRQASLNVSDAVYARVRAEVNRRV